MNKAEKISAFLSLPSGGDDSEHYTSDIFIFFKCIRKSRGEINAVLRYKYIVPIRPR